MASRHNNRKTSNPNVVRLNSRERTIKINAAVIVFGMILLYVIANVLRAWLKVPVTTYKVSSSNINNNITTTCIALRKEIEVKSNKSGYLIYYVREGDKVRKNGPVCTVDETKTILNAIEDTSDEGTKKTKLTNSDLLTVRTAIDNYKNSYSDVNFADIYNFKGNIESKVMELSNQVMRQEVAVGGAALSATLENINSPESGIIAYYTDGYEEYTPDTIPASAFNKTDYKKNSINSGEILESGNTVFKIVSDENWSLVVPITPEQMSTIMNQRVIIFKLDGGPIELSSTDFTTEQRSDSCYLTINMSKYMIDYLDKRFLTIEIILNKYDGLKIPNSSMVEMETYLVPPEYIHQNESNDNCVTVIKTDADGSQHEEEVMILAYKKAERTKKDTDVEGAAASATDAAIASSTDALLAAELSESTGEDKNEYYFINTKYFDETDMLKANGAAEAKPVLSLLRERLTGVYRTTRGTALFTEITIVKSQDEFTIVKNNEKLNEFDNIVLDSSDVEENQQIY